MFWTKRTGHLSDEDLSAYIDGELSGGRLDAAHRHVASCPDCTAAIDQLRQVKTLVSRLPQVEPSRSFVLSPSMAGEGQKRPQPAPRRTSFAFVPAVALTLLVALFAADLTVSTSDTSNDEASTASEAMVAKDAGSNVAADSAGGAGAAEGQQRSTFAAQPTPNPAAAPSTSGPVTGQAPTPTPISPQAQTAPSAAGSQPVPSQNVAPQTAPQQPPTPAPQQPVPPPATGQGVAPGVAPGPGATPSGALGSEAAPLGNQQAGTLEDSAGDSARDSSLDQTGDEGRNWLRIAQVVVAIGFVVSALYVFGPGLIKKGH